MSGAHLLYAAASLGGRAERHQPARPGCAATRGGWVVSGLSPVRCLVGWVGTGLWTVRGLSKYPSYDRDRRRLDLADAAYPVVHTN